MTRTAKEWSFAGVCAIAIVAVFGFVPPIAQNPAYHHFADARTLLGLSNFADVASNALFLPAGLYGLWVAVKLSPGRVRAALAVFFAGVVLVGPGSMYYHLAPDNGTLFWDRLPMTVAFMGLLAAVLEERVVRGDAARWLLPALVAVGIASVVYWRLSESAGTGDLRAYVLVQYLPMVLIPLALVLFPRRRFLIGWQAVLGAFAFYALAKGAEYFDAQILDALGGHVSGHTFKHLFAALAPVAVAWAVRKRAQALSSSSFLSSEGSADSDAAAG